MSAQGVKRISSMRQKGKLRRSVRMPYYAPPMAALNEVIRTNCLPPERRVQKRTNEILSAIRTVNMEDRVTCTPKHSRPPIGSPPSLKRDRNDEDSIARRSKRQKTASRAQAARPLQESTVSTKSASELKDAKIILAELMSCPPDIIMGPRKTDEQHQKHHD